jgi:curved DNA-binding protein CbpA
MNSSWKENNFYEILEVPFNATQREIHEAFRRAKTTYSVDNPALYTMFTREEAQELLKMIEEAYEVLSNQRLRAAYDQQLSTAQPAQYASAANGYAPTTSAFPAAMYPPASTYREESTLHQMPQPTTTNTSSSSLERAPVTVVVEEKSVQFDDGSISVVRTKVRSYQSSDGKAQTMFGSYKINPELEEEIKGATDFDGHLLQRIRQYKNINMDQMSTATKVTKHYLEAVERMDSKSLPAHVFVRGFVSHMARVLGLNEKTVTDSYMKILKAQKQ